MQFVNLIGKLSIKAINEVCFWDQGTQDHISLEKLFFLIFFFFKTTRKLFSRLAFLYTEPKSLLIFLTVVKVDKQVSRHALLGQHLFHVNSFWKTEVKRNLVAHILKQFGMLR